MLDFAIKMRFFYIFSKKEFVGLGKGNNRGF